ncbi:unnamed protein product [Paramecium sonneborni]|uniref:Uncharacterized protein n=1 Tax=Paramecium sonneborni TaxID=65129 RepID=A0A8S1RRW0_9CILI|nr:unnamed protein product [Paramecium sonneborni]
MLFKLLKQYYNAVKLNNQLIKCFILSLPNTLNHLSNIFCFVLDSLIISNLSCDWYINLSQKNKLSDINIGYWKINAVNQRICKLNIVDEKLSELFTQSQHDVKQLKNCLAKVDTQMNEDQKLKYQQANNHLEMIKSEFIKLQQELHHSQQQSIQDTQRYPQQLTNQLYLIMSSKEKINSQIKLIKAYNNKLIPQTFDTLIQKLIQFKNCQY